MEGRNAELLLWRRRPEEAEAILLGAKLIYRAIDMNMRLFRWDRALEIAKHHQSESQTFIDIVVAMRERYLKGMGREEQEGSPFLAFRDNIKIDWDAIRNKIKQEHDKEARRPGAGPYQDKQY